MHLAKMLRGVCMAVLAAVAQPATAEDDFGFSDLQTRRTVDTFTYGMAECAKIEKVYRIDCLRQTYSQTVRVISKASVYWEAEVALTRVNRGLYAFVRQNVDGDLGRVRVNGGRIKAVTAASMDQATPLYMAAVDQAVAVMQSGNSSEVFYFTPIAEAILQSKELLR